MSIPSLFAGEWSAVAGESPVIETPFGSLSFGVAADGVALLGTPAARWSLDDARLFVWDSPLARVELLFVTPLFERYGSERLTARAAMFRIQATRGLGALELAARVDTALPGTPESGECLASVLWERDELKLSLGTQDFPALAASNRPLPRAWHVPDPELVAIDRCEADGIRLTLPPLDAGESAQVQFVAAWGPRIDADDVSTWLAVDLRPEEILAAIAR